MENNKIVASCVQTNGSREYLLCEMRDGSQWTCDLDGTNWEKVKLSDEELTEKFNAR